MKTIKEVKKQLKELGYSVKTRTYSEFRAFEVVHNESKVVINFGVSTEAFYLKHKPAFDLIKDLRKTEAL